MGCRARGSGYTLLGTAGTGVNSCFFYSLVLNLMRGGDSFGEKRATIRCTAVVSTE